ncbi:MAG: hypothetical protein BWY78_00434 [Alphaproteobacteria bacterium ADurb.Bin438]|nr:MAG: hypothetical protein BWY78_00434 [Alphaproteobacteria bacterium ADurb.Bin438]
MDKKYIKLLILTLLITISTYVKQSMALDNDAMFSALSISVDAVDKDATLARKQAIANGQSLGLFKVLERIVAPKDFENLPEVPDEIISDMVQDISVSDEKTSKVRYIANLDIRYKPESIKKYLKDLGVSFVQAPSKPYLLLPLYYSQSNEVFLWESLNSWAKAWIMADYSVIPLIIPEGNEEDIKNIDIKDILSINKDAFLNWQKLYNANGGVIIAEIKDLGNRLKFKAIKYENGVEKEVIQLNYSYKNDLASALKTIVKNYILKTESNYRDSHSINIADDTFLTVVVPLSSISDWLNIESKLKEIATITKIELKAIKKDKAQIELWFADGLDNLSTSLNEKELEIKLVSDDIYEITYIKEDDSNLKE